MRVIKSYAPQLEPMFYYRDKTWVQMFYFLIKLQHQSRYAVFWFYIR